MKTSYRYIELSDEVILDSTRWCEVILGLRSYFKFQFWPLACNFLFFFYVFQIKKRNLCFQHLSSACGVIMIIKRRPARCCIYNREEGTVTNIFNDTEKSIILQDQRKIQRLCMMYVSDAIRSIMLAKKELLSEHQERKNCCHQHLQWSGMKHSTCTYKFYKIGVNQETAYWLIDWLCFVFN